MTEEFVRYLEMCVNFHHKNDESFKITDSAYEVGMGEPYFSIFIPTLECEMRADPYDYIIKGVNGEFYPCKPDIFEKTYDVIER